MLGVVADAGFAFEQRAHRGVIEVTMRIEPTRAFAEPIDGRDHVAVAASLRTFLAPAGIAVYGASARRGTIGGELFRNVLAGGFAGPAHPINRSGEAVAGVPGLTTLRGVEPTVELAVICVPAAAVLAAAADALAAGVRSLCVVSAGFAEVGREGAERQDELLALVRAHGGRLVGPNCLGIAATAHRLNATFAAQPLPPGGVGFASQSGALGLAVVEQARERGLGLSAFVSLGNKADVSSNDLLEYWEDDAATTVVALYLESFGNPARFARIARRVAAPQAGARPQGRCHGRGRARRRIAHGRDRELRHAVDALFRQAGVLRTRTLSEFLDAALLLSSQPLPLGPRVAVVTNAGGLGILFADACAAEGLELAQASLSTRERLRAVMPGRGQPRQPDRPARLGHGRDVRRGASARAGRSRVRRGLRPLRAAGRGDGRRCGARHRRGGGRLRRAQARGRRPAHGRGPRTRGRPTRVHAAFASPEAAARALGVAARRAAWLRRPEGVVPLPAGRGSLRRARAASRPLAGADEERGSTPIRAAGCSRPTAFRSRPRPSPPRLPRPPPWPRRWAGPVVVKSAVPGAHKTETGGVQLDLRGAEAVRAAAARIGGAVLVQPMLEGAELIAGMVRDPVFGPLIALGLGGVLTELVAAASVGIAPLTDVDAADLVAAGPVGRLMAGFRGQPPLDAAATADLLPPSLPPGSPARRSPSWI